MRAKEDNMRCFVVFAKFGSALGTIQQAVKWNLHAKFMNA
jgi:hypothetical protein